MKINSMYSGRAAVDSLFSKSKIGVSGNKTKALNKNNGNKEDQKSNTEKTVNKSNVIKVNDDTSDKMIENLKKQIENIKANDSMSDKAKAVRIENLMKRIDAVEKEEQKRKVTELKKAVEGDSRSEAEKAASRQAKRRKAEIERNARSKNVDISISELAMENLISAEMRIGRTKELSVTKAKVEKEVAFEKANAKFDKSLQKGISERLSGEKIQTVSKKISHDVEHEYKTNLEKAIYEINQMLSDVGINDSEISFSGDLGTLNESLDALKEKLTNALAMVGKFVPEDYVSDSLAMIAGEINSILSDFVKSGAAEEHPDAVKMIADKLTEISEKIMDTSKTFSITEMKGEVSERLGNLMKEDDFFEEFSVNEKDINKWLKKLEKAIDMIGKFLTAEFSGAQVNVEEAEKAETESTEKPKHEEFSEEENKGANTVNIFNDAVSEVIDIDFNIDTDVYAE